MRYDWDENKNNANIAKHGFDFSLAENFDWSTAMTMQDLRKDYNEVRWIALGLIETKLFVLVYVYRKNIIRLISLRKANKRERTYYEKSVKH